MVVGGRRRGEGAERGASQKKNKKKTRQLLRLRASKIKTVTQLFCFFFRKCFCASVNQQFTNIRFVRDVRAVRRRLLIHCVGASQHMVPCGVVVYLVWSSETQCSSYPPVLHRAVLGASMYVLSYCTVLYCIVLYCIASYVIVNIKKY